MEQAGEVTTWLDKWIAEDFSWNGLLSKPSWDSAAPNLQELMRSYTRIPRSDEQLLSDGLLIDCGEYGLFHVIFVPPAWTMNGPVALKLPDLVARQESAWSSLRSFKIKEMFSGLIAGPHLPTSVAPGLIGGTRASFSWTSFRGKLESIPCRQDRFFRNCIFHGPVKLAENIRESVPPRVSFAGCEIHSDMHIRDLETLREVLIADTYISGKLDFHGICGARVRIECCALSTFDSLGCNFTDEVSILESSIELRFSLTRCTFNRSFSVVATTLNRGIELLDCDFKDRVSLADVDWSEPAQLAVSAEGSKFLATVSFNGDQPPPIQLFQNVEFESSVSFSPISDARLRALFYDELKAPPVDESTPYDHSKHAQAVESGCRTLRKLAESRGDVHHEHFWHRAEIIARRATGESGLSEKTFSFLYGCLADYGLSISRPFIALAISTLIFALLYGWIGGSSWVGNLEMSSIGEGVGYSLNRTLPIGVFSDEATTQTIFSAILMFLGVMAVRRKFRIT